MKSTLNRLQKKKDFSNQMLALKLNCSMEDVHKLRTGRFAINSTRKRNLERKIKELMREKPE